MNEKFKNRHSDDPNSLTTDDREVMNVTNPSATDVKDALNENRTGAAIASGRHFPETGPRLIFGVVLVIAGIIIAVATSISVIGIIIGAVMVIAGIILPFVNFHAGAGRRDTV
ncbi:MAG TPA: hypothetical protein VGC97_04140 [Pyrinomonadaceae bacterium]|jgi:hypothetical protein